VVFQAMEDFGAEIEHAMRADASPGGPVLERFEQFWSRVIDSFRTTPEVWRATFDVFAVAQGIDDGRALWASAATSIVNLGRSACRGRQYASRPRCPGLTGYSSVLSAAGPAAGHLGNHRGYLPSRIGG
jgi:hypothetical protein